MKNQNALRFSVLMHVNFDIEEKTFIYYILSKRADVEIAEGTLIFPWIERAKVG